ncbi:MAG: nitroreductase [Alphaproteobacteria bacterium]|nr:nitroreductase [Alphaproteobacteria bacterium]
MDTIERSDIAATVEAALDSRFSARAFLSTPVPRETVEEILALASRAPSGVNMQPWKMSVIGGETRAALERDLLAAHDDGGMAHQEVPYYPAEPFPEPYKTRRRTVGWALYGALGIGKGEREKTHAQHARNYRFFDAPVAMIFTIERILEIGSWLDYGMFLQSIMVAARAKGLHTCAQAAFARFPDIIRKHLIIPHDEIVICGMSMGYLDHAAPENDFRTEREPVESFARFLDF